MPKRNIFSIPVSKKRQVSMRGKFIFFSSVLFLLIFILGSGAFIMLMERILLTNAGHELIKTVELERLKLEAYVNSEIAIVLKMADSPLIRRYFSAPGDPELEKMAFEEFDAYQRAFTAGSVFWVNDTDKIFYSIDHESYKVDPDNPDNYWYPMTLNETEIYNFNINYNPDLSVTNLWINAPVFNSENIPIGIVGTGINLSDFIDSIYRDYSETASMYFFNTAGEITGAMNIDLVANKINIDDELYKIGKEILATAKNLEPGGIKYIRNMREVAVLGSIPALDWYVIAVQRLGIADSLNTGMTVLFLVMMAVIFAVFVVFNRFVAGLLAPLNCMINKMSQLASDWNLNPQSKISQKDEVKTLSEFLDITITMMNDKLQAERNAHESELAKGRAEAAREAIISSLEYASKIQKNLLPPDKVFKEAFDDYHCLWKPRDIVGGDIYWIKNFPNGTVLCVCDCTGHGTPGALLTMLVTSVFEATVTEHNCNDTAGIIWQLEKRLVAGLNVKHTDKNTDRALTINDGCDLAVLFIAKNGSVTISSGNISVIVCDGEKVTRLKGQRICVGDGTLRAKSEIKATTVPANPENKFYIASDGVYEQIGTNGFPFGYDAMMDIILKNHNEWQYLTLDILWKALENHRGNNPIRDDIEIIAFKPKIELYEEDKT